MTTPLPAGPFDVILADPPWHFASNSAARPGHNVRRHYPTMRLPEICAMPVPQVSARDALLFLWATAPCCHHAFAVMRAWGFTYKSQLVWVKHRQAMGFWARNRHELVLIGRRGRFPCPRPAPFPDSVIEAPTREHSRKPDDLQDRIDATWPQTRRLELFARSTRPGWTAWGNDTGRFTTGDAA